MNEIIEGVKTEPLNDKFNDLKRNYDTLVFRHSFSFVSFPSTLILSSQCVARLSDKTKETERQGKAEKRNRNCLFKTTWKAFLLSMFEELVCVKT